MSDFLTNLAARGSGSASAIQPRLPSLFEPSTLAVGSPAAGNFAANFDLEQVATEQNNRTSEASAHATDSPAPPLDALRPEHKEETTPTPPQQMTNTRMPAAPVPAANVEPPKDRPRPPAHPLFQASESKLKPPASIVPETIAPDLPYGLDRNVVEHPHNARAIDRPPSVSAEKNGSDVRANGERPARVEPSQFPVEYISRLARSLIQPGAESRSGESRNGAATSRSTRSEPAIQVTIGRIEVRATSQQPPVAKERSPLPVMSLDEYLRQKRNPT